MRPVYGTARRRTRTARKKSSSVNVLFALATSDPEAACMRGTEKVCGPMPE